MRIWITEIGEPLPMEGAVRLQRYGMLSRELARRGHEVVWWTSNFSHTPKKFITTGDWSGVVDGVTLRALDGLGYRRNVSIQRFRHQAHFARRFYAEAPKHEKPDVLISPVPTIEAAAMATRFAVEQKIPIVTDIRDEWPDEFVDIAPKPLRWAARIALDGYFRKMEFICRNVTGIIGTSQKKLGYALRFARRSRGANDCVLPIGYQAETGNEEKIAAARAWWKEQGVRENAFICCFFGTIGRFFDLDTVIEAARLMRRSHDIQLVLAGDGSSFARFREQARDLDNVLFPGWIDQPKIAALMQMAHAGLAPYARGARMSLPNKPFEYFSGALPVLSSLKGELEEILVTRACGLNYEADSAEQLVSRLRYLHSNPSERKVMGERGRQLLVEEFSVEVIARRYEEHLEKVARAHAGPLTATSLAR